MLRFTFVVLFALVNFFLFSSSYAQGILPSWMLRYKKEEAVSPPPTFDEEKELLRKLVESERSNKEALLKIETQKNESKLSDLAAEVEMAKQRQSELEKQLAKKPNAIGRKLNAHAIVIGNSAYSGSSKLANPFNDAKAISLKLRSLGFVVTDVFDANRNQLVSSLSKFSKSAENAELSLLFYAGHGVQIANVNYILPVDLNMNDLNQVPLQGISLTSVVDQYLPGKTKLVFLDACRDNPLMQTASRSVSRGLAPINASEGTLISYATKDGQTAMDGDGKNSPFTTALLEHLGDPDDIAVVLRKVREKVMRNTNNRQQPWEYGSLTGGELVLSAIK